MPTSATIERRSKTKTVQRSKTNKPAPLYSATVRRTWDKMPPDGLVTRGTVAALAGVNVRTVQRHVERGLLPHGNVVAKSDVDKWLAGVGSLRPGRPSRWRLRNARQRVLPL